MNDMITDAMVEAAARKFLKVVKPSAASRPMEELNSVDIDDMEVEVLDAMRAALTAALAAAWRPISEAPHNVEVLVCGVGADGFYVANGKRFKDTWFLYDLCDDDFSIESSGHTNWMPRPEPPKEVEG